MTGWWCRLCDTPVTEPLWMGTGMAVPYHLCGQSRHAIHPTVGGPPPDHELTYAMVVKDGGRYVELEPEGVTP